jgi:hypothetical protein
MEVLLRRTWWAYDAKNSLPADAVYHYFNLFEAGAWFVFAALVLVRYAKFRRSLLEPIYAIAFLCFGVTDLLEARALTSWLVWIKFGNVIALFWLRAIVIKRFYPGSKLF